MSDNESEADLGEFDSASFPSDIDDGELYASLAPFLHFYLILFIVFAVLCDIASE